MSTVYLLFYDTVTGCSEEWNYNYTPCEVFSCPEDREKRIEYLKTATNEDGDLYGYEFMRLDVVTMASDDLENHPDTELSEEKRPKSNWTFSHEYLESD